MKKTLRLASGTIEKINVNPPEASIQERRASAMARIQHSYQSLIASGFIVPGYPFLTMSADDQGDITGIGAAIAMNNPPDGTMIELPIVQAPGHADVSALEAKAICNGFYLWIAPRRRALRQALRELETSTDPESIMIEDYLS